jgi:uncharacterized phage protein gp47/JayE
MALNIPSTAAEIDRRSKNDVKNELTQANPFLRNSWLGAIVTSLANRMFDFYFTLDQVQKESIPDTAEIQLERWASIFGIIRDEATIAEGGVTFTGTLQETIPINTILATSDGLEYNLLANTTIATVVNTVTSITRSGATATVLTVAAHGLSNNVRVTIEGANETDYNGTFDIIVLDDDEFSYTVPGTPSTPASGSITATGSYGNGTVQSLEFGEDQNQEFGTPLNLQSPILGVDDECLVAVDGLVGGVDVQSDDDLRSELLERIRNPVAHFNSSDIITKAKTRPGVTRVFVEEVTPAVGQVTVYFMRDNDEASTIPSAQQSTLTKNDILEITPANTDPSDLFVSGPTEVNQNFVFSALSPDTSTMRTAVSASLEQFFKEKTEVGENVVQEAYNAAIFNTLDTTNGNVIESFTVTTPAGDITVNSGEIATLGSITYP